MTVNNTTNNTAKEKAQATLKLYEERKTPGILEMAWQRFRRDKLAMFGTVLLLILSGLAAGAPLVSKYITKYTPEEIELSGILKTPGYQKNAELNCFECYVPHN